MKIKITIIISNSYYIYYYRYQYSYIFYKYWTCLKRSNFKFETLRPSLLSFTQQHTLEMASSRRLGCDHSLFLLLDFFFFCKSPASEVLTCLDALFRKRLAVFKESLRKLPLTSKPSENLISNYFFYILLYYLIYMYAKPQNFLLSFITTLKTLFLFDKFKTLPGIIKKILYLRSSILRIVLRLERQINALCILADVAQLGIFVYIFRMFLYFINFENPLFYFYLLKLTNFFLIFGITNPMSTFVYENIAFKLFLKKVLSNLLEMFYKIIDGLIIRYNSLNIYIYMMMMMNFKLKVFEGNISGLISITLNNFIHIFDVCLKFYFYHRLLFGIVSNPENWEIPDISPIPFSRDPEIPILLSQITTLLFMCNARNVCFNQFLSRDLYKYDFTIKLFLEKSLCFYLYYS
uniref:Uncharacterized protein n=1 Tax=Heterorhabditis bacteriophora TaxID=37862 RepID=A0A1I7WFI1_HETBA